MGLFIGGEWRDNGRTFDVYNPATGEKLAAVVDGQLSDAVDAIDAAHKAFDAWSNSTAYARAEVLHKAHALMMSRKSQLAELMTREQGKPLKAANTKAVYIFAFEP